MFYGHFWFFFGNVSVVWMKNWATLCKTKQKYANFCQISPNICKIVQKYALFCLKKTVKITFHPMKMCSKRGCLEASWVDVQCFCANWWRSRWLLNVCGHFWPFLTGFLLNGFFVTIDPFERFWNFTGLEKRKNRFFGQKIEEKNSIFLLRKSIFGTAVVLHTEIKISLDVEKASKIVQKPGRHVQQYLKTIQNSCRCHRHIQF